MQQPIIEFGHFLVGLKQARNWIAASGVVMALVALGLSFLMTPIYMAEVLIAPVETDNNMGQFSSLLSQFGGLAGLAGFDANSQSIREEAIATLTSRSLTEIFISENNLLPVLFAEIWDEPTQSWDVDDEEDVPTLWDAYYLFEKIRTVTEDRRSRLILLEVEWEDPELAADWANELVHLTNFTLRTRAIEEAKKSLDFLGKELSKTSVVELRQSIYGLVESQISKEMMANVREEYAFKIIDPARSADLDRYVKPQRVLMAMLGLVFGVFLAVAFVYMRQLAAAMAAQET